MCNNAAGNRKIEINRQLNQYRQQARAPLTSKEGRFRRRKRPIEPEAVFGQTKANKRYDRFRHFESDKVKTDFAIFAVVFNIGKMFNKSRNMSKNQKKQPSPAKIIIMMAVTLLHRPIYMKQANYTCTLLRLAASMKKKKLPFETASTPISPPPPDFRRLPYTLATPHKGQSPMPSRK